MARIITNLGGRLGGAPLGVDPGPVPGANAIRTSGGATSMNWGPNPNPIPEARVTTAGIFSCWYYRPSTSIFITGNMWRMRNTGGGVIQEVDFPSNTGGRAEASLEPTVLSQGLIMNSLSNYTPAFQWVHMLLSWNLPGIGLMTVNGYFVPVAERATNIVNGDGLPWNEDRPNAYQSGDSTEHGFYGLFIDIDNFMDVSAASNIAKFINTSTYEPVALGPTGQTPNGSQPMIYFDNPAAQITNNRGFATNPVIDSGAYIDSNHGPTSPARFAHDNEGSAGLSALMTALGAGSSQVFSLSCWLFPNGASGSFFFVDDGTTTYLDIGWNGSDRLTYTARNEAGTVILQGESTGAPLPAAWHHVAFSINMGAATGPDSVKIWIDGLDVTQAPTTFVGSQSIGFGATNTTLYVGNDGSSSNDLCYSQCWIDFDTFVDFSVSTTLDLFVDSSAGKRPVDLGDDGSTPLSAQPQVYLHAPTYIGATQQPHANNLGAGGNFTVINASNWESCTTNPAAEFLV